MTIKGKKLKRIEVENLNCEGCFFDKQDKFDCVYLSENGEIPSCYDFHKSYIFVEEK